MSSAEPSTSAVTAAGPGAAAGVTEEIIRHQVHSFYAKARRDPVLGPIFNSVVTDWDEHLDRICDFWSAVLLRTARFHGTPMAAHARIPGLSSVHFTRWLDLFHQTTEEVCPPDAAALFIAKSEMIAKSLKLGTMA